MQVLGLGRHRLQLYAGDEPVVVFEHATIFHPKPKDKP